MSSPDKASILQKIKACFNLASEKANTTEAEMATALSMAKMLMAKHMIDEAEVLATQTEGTAEPIVEEVTVETRLHPHQYEGQLAMVCGDLFGVTPIKMPSGKGSVIRMFGLTTDVQLAAEVFKDLRDRINAMAMKCGFDGTERDQWRVGVVHTLRIRSRAAKSGLSQKDEEKCTALVVTKNALIKKHIQERVGRVTSGKSRVTANEAYYAGKNAGHSVSLDFRKKLSH